MTEENKSLYQTSNHSLKDMSFPNTPVKPANITARDAIANMILKI
ncbi:hypothetical protein [Chryseobacterium antibioticum]|nr:hypothetical protein [Chryseobacterium antibioticum]